MGIVGAGMMGASSQYTYVRAITLGGLGSVQEQPAQQTVTTAGPSTENLSDRLMRFIHPVREPFSPTQFVERTIGFLNSIGVVHIASFEADGTPVYTVRDGATTDLGLFGEKAKAYFDSHDASIHQMDMKLFGRSDYFFLDMVLTYRPVHSPHEPGLSLTFGATPMQLHAMETETLADYEVRMEKLRTDSAELEKLQKETGEKGKEFTSDLAHHISESFPGAHFKVFEMDESDERLG
jgi:hypothetical protein